MAMIHRSRLKSAKRTIGNSPAIDRWVRSARVKTESGQRTPEVQSGFLRMESFSRPFHGLFPGTHATFPALKCWAIFMPLLRGLCVTASRRRGYLLTALFLLLTAHCSLLTVNCQPGIPQPNSPLYGARPES